MIRREFLVTAAGAVGITGCSRESQPTPLREVSISLAEHVSVSPVYLAEELGFFREAGIRIRPVRMSAMQAMPVLAGGKLDVAFGGVSAAVFNAIARGQMIRVVGGREQVSSTCGEAFTLFVRKSAFGSGPIDPRRIRGKRIGVRLRGITEFVLDVFLKQIQLPYDAVEKIDLPLSEALAALSTSKIDGLLDMELAQSPLAKSPDFVKLWKLADSYPDHQYSFLLFGESLLKKDPGLGARFLAAYMQGAKKFLEGQTPKFMREFATAHGMDVEQTVAACRTTLRGDAGVDLPSIQRVMDWSLARKYSTQAMQAPQVVDSGPATEAKRLLESGGWKVKAS